MNRRQAKKLIPKNTIYCYKILGRVGRIFKTKHCPHLRHMKDIDTMIDVSGTLSHIKMAVYICKFTGINTDEDASLFDDCKVCGVI